MMRIIESKADQEKFLAWAGEELYNRFLKQKQRLSGQETDMYYWMKKTPEELDARLSELESTPTRSQKSATASDGARVVYQDDNWTIRQIDTFEASAKYGKGTKWCITGADFWGGVEKGRGYFNDYYDEGVRFLFFESKKPINGRHKWALASHKLGRYEIYNEVDNRVYEIPGLPSIDGLNHIKKTGYVRCEDRNGVQYIALNDSTLLYDDLTIQHCFREDWRAEDANNYESSDVKKYLESGDFANDAYIGVHYNSIYLLSIKEAEQLPEDILKYGRSWWLRSKGKADGNVAFVFNTGEINSLGIQADEVLPRVRPVFKISKSEMENIDYLEDIENVEFTPENVIKW